MFSERIRERSYMTFTKDVMILCDFEQLIEFQSLASVVQSLIVFIVIYEWKNYNNFLDLVVLCLAFQY